MLICNFIGSRVQNFNAFLRKLPFMPFVLIRFNRFQNICLQVLGAFFFRQHFVD